MSLTDHLRYKDFKDSPVRRFLHETFPNTRPPLAECREAMRARTLILGEGVSGGAYSQIGLAIDYRIRYHFAGLLSRDMWVEDEWHGAIPDDLWRARDADGMSTVWWRVRDGRTERLEQRSDLIATYGASFVVRSDDPWEDAWWRTQLLDPGVAEESRLSSACVAGFFEALDRSVDKIVPHRRRPTDAEERTLARFCLVLAAFEAVYRAGPIVWPPRYFGESLPESAEALLALVPDYWVEDAAALGTAFSVRYPEWQGANAELNPNFAGSADIDGADADLIVDGCLWEIKTTKMQRGQGKWLHQLLGYALLDYEDEYGIDRVGVLLPRHNTQVSWPIRDLIAAMSDRDDLDLPELRRDFRAVCEEVRDQERERIAGLRLNLK